MYVLLVMLVVMAVATLAWLHNNDELLSLVQVVRHLT